MSWHFLQGPEAESWEAPSLDGAPDALSRLIPSLATSYWRDNETSTCTASRFGTMCVPSRAARGAEQLTLFRVDSHVRTLARRVKVEELPEVVRACGLKCSESLARFGLVLSSPKTRRICVPVDSAPSSADLPRWGMMQDGECWELGTSARHISGIAFGFLPTPTTIGNELAPSMQKWPSHRRLVSWLKEHGKAPTPTVSMGHMRKTDRPGREKIDGITHGVSRSIREWMMGLPEKWTSLEPLGTRKFQWWRQQHSEYLARAYDE